MGILIGIAVAGLFVVVAALMMRQKTNAPVPAPEAEPTAAAPAPATKTDAFERVTLEQDGTVYGAVPPFGVFTREGDIAVFTAKSRVVAADNAGIATGDGASTIQSLGSMEFGEFRHTFTPAQVAALDTGDNTPESALLISDDEHTFRLVGLGGRGGELAVWLKG